MALERSSGSLKLKRGMLTGQRVFIIVGLVVFLFLVFHHPYSNEIIRERYKRVMIQKRDQVPQRVTEAFTESNEGSKINVSNIEDQPDKEKMTGQQDQVQHRVTEAFAEWTKCFKKDIFHLKDQPEKFWGEMWRGVNECQELEPMKSINMMPYSNSDETKYHVHAASPEAMTVLVTLGVGHDIAAEEKLKKELKNARFYGADPITEVNEELYLKVGKFFPFAVGAEMGISNASILNNKEEYESRTVVHIDVINFLTKFVNETFIDQFWIDAEGAEYGMFPAFYDGNLFDQNGITICQFNIEVHRPTLEQKKLFHDYIQQLIEDERYAIFRPILGGHYRLFMINHRDPFCVAKYLTQFIPKESK